MANTPGSPSDPESGDFVPATPELLYERRGAVALLTFNRPAARNAMTFAMYDGLHAACEHVDADDRVRVFVLRGAGDRAFVAGTDIAQFQDFSTAADALGYEERISRYVGRLEAVQKPTIAQIQGYCVGGGAVLAVACDLRLASPDAQFGVPIARTLGITLSVENVGRLVALLGDARTLELLYTARLMGSEESHAVGLYNEIVAADRLEARVFELADQITAHAPLTLRSIKESVRRLRAHGRPPPADDLILMCYLSADFREGIAAFLAKRPPRWEGR